MKFPLYFSKKIAFSKDNKNNLSRIIIFIGRLSVALGIIVSLITVSVGFGSKEAIKLRMADFSGHINIKSKRSNSSYDSSVLDRTGLDLKKIRANPDVATAQNYVSVSGILRNEHNFAGVVMKGIGKDFDHERFKKFIVKGNTPKVTEDGYNNGVVISEKIASDLHLGVKDSIVAIFSKQNQQPLYRNFEVIGIYKTDIKMIDDQFILGDINHARKILDMEKNDVGGIDIFLKDVNDIEKETPEIDRSVGLKNYTEKATEKYPQIVDWINIFDNNIAVIIVIMLSVVIINIVMVLLILIIERTNSIGLLKTLGASNGQIRTLFIYYTLLIMVPGLIFGNLIGFTLLGLQKIFSIIKLNPENYYISTVPVDLNPLIPVVISAGILLVSAFAMIFPSYLISKISPVKSIKYT
ncbi:ABC transporter permease [Marnyiella aurantia]|uniref:ABC transporter permease n=1 Tax=Marnyiella aurantia TaxID=2758037 RepID=A0A7D7LQI2_9FLAO|nr:FtsX-like permease family protein [Marnyiella aurantia]MBA5245760.1 ABC transporter permease [Marnyiella aurantia]QMS98836.1 ABC transporter permease [Marnyiella aurantia]